MAKKKTAAELEETRQQLTGENETQQQDIETFTTNIAIYRNAALCRDFSDLVEYNVLELEKLPVKPLCMQKVLQFVLHFPAAANLAFWYEYIDRKIDIYADGYFDETKLDFENIVDFAQSPFGKLEASREAAADCKQITLCSLKDAAEDLSENHIVLESLPEEIIRLIPGCEHITI